MTDRQRIINAAEEYGFVVERVERVWGKWAVVMLDRYRHRIDARSADVVVAGIKRSAAQREKRPAICDKCGETVFGACRCGGVDAKG